MRAVCFLGQVEGLEQGIGWLAPRLGLRPEAGGLPVTVRRGQALRVRWQSGAASIEYREKVQFFRLLGLLAQGLSQPGEQGRQGQWEEKPCFAHCGVLLDCSRNAVPTPETVQELLCRMALLGMDEAMLYTEDVYTLPGQPYFGYLRGRYTPGELRACDDVADALGIALIPCIQTLGHLEKVLRWPFAQPLRDTPDILLVGSPQTDEWIGQMLDAATKPLRSRRIHLGMDEAGGLGTGRYKAENGVQSGTDILRRHLDRVWALCRARGLSPMIWSDMCLRPLSPSGDYYDTAHFPQQLPPAVANSVPPQIGLVYWDYYHEDEASYRALLRLHRQFANPVIFAGGCWTWNGVAPNYGKMWATTQAALAACKAEGVQEVWCTVWFDNGAETPLPAALPGLQLFAEHAYRAAPARSWVEQRFAFCQGAPWADFWLLNGFDQTPGVLPGNPNACCPAKQLLYQDLMVGQFDADAEGLPLDSHYAALAEACAAAARRNPAYRQLFALYEALARVLTVKALAGVQMQAAYRAGDRAQLRQWADEKLPRLQDALTRLKTAWAAQWFALNKPFGYEVLDMRLGAVQARTQSARARLLDYLEGWAASLPEWEEPRLPFGGQAQGDAERFSPCNRWERIVSACPIDGV